MFLKHYLKLSDEKLLERFNTDWAMQMFCGVLFEDNQRGTIRMIKDNAFVSNERTYLAKHIDLEAFQQVLIAHWSGFKNFQYYYEHLVQKEFISCFPKLPSYQRFIELIAR